VSAAAPAGPVVPPGPSAAVRADPAEPGVLRLVGDVDHAAVVAAEPLVASLAGTVRVVDVGDVAFVDSAGVDLLLRLRAAAPDGHLVLRRVVPDGLVASLLALLGLSGAFADA
jgi:anti-anti-sigma factor